MPTKNCGTLLGRSFFCHSRLPVAASTQVMTCGNLVEHHGRLCTNAFRLCRHPGAHRPPAQIPNDAVSRQSDYFNDCMISDRAFTNSSAA